MEREMGFFPYRTPNTVANADTDGTLVSVPTGRDLSIDGPTQQMMRPKNRGAIIDGGIGDTDYLDANTTAHTVFTGSY
jgi:hypothetical protein